MKSCSFAAISTSLLMLLSFGCGGNTPATAIQSSQPSIVYVAGVELVGTLYKAVYWKDGVITHLDSGQYGARATGIAAANGHVYVSGYIGSVTGGYNQAVLWIDGAMTALAAKDRTSSTTSVTVIGQDVYVTGCESELPGVGAYYSTSEYWKNGSAVPLVTNTTGGCLTAIASSGTDLYVLGSITGHTLIGPNSYSNQPVVTVWKNSTSQPLTDGTTFSTSSGLTVANGHVYVAGSLCPTLAPNCSQAAYWADGVLTFLQPSILSQASGIALSGSTLYTSINASTTSGGNLAEFSSGGVVTALASDAQSSANGIATYNGDVYVAGFDYYGPCIWKNRLQSYLTGAQGGNNSTAVAIAVVPSN